MVSSCCPASEPGFLPPWHSAFSIQQSPVETGCSRCKMEASIISVGLCLPEHSLLLRSRFRSSLWVSSWRAFGHLRALCFWGQFVFPEMELSPQQEQCWCLLGFSWPLPCVQAGGMLRRIVSGPGGFPTAGTCLAGTRAPSPDTPVLLKPPSRKQRTENRGSM